MLGAYCTQVVLQNIWRRVIGNVLSNISPSNIIPTLFLSEWFQSCQATKTSLTILVKSFKWKHSCEKYSKEICWLEHHQQLSFKYFAKWFLIFKILTKVSWIQMTISRGTLNIYELKSTTHCSIKQGDFVRVRRVLCNISIPYSQYLGILYHFL